MRLTSFGRWPKRLMVSWMMSAFLFGLAGASLARETSFWTSETAADFRGGTAECISISRRGTVSLAPSLDTLLSAEESYIWCLAEDGMGNLYAGSGDRGRVYKVDSKGAASVVLESEELEVLSLAVDAEGCVFAGTSPGGLIYKITPEGESSVFFASGESYIWCLAFDDGGDLYAGSGDRGRIYRIRPNGRGEVFYETDERHVMCALFAYDRLVVGTEGSGLVMSISGPQKAEVLYDCDEDEVRDLDAAEDGTLYAASVSRSNNEEGASQPSSQEFGVAQAERKKSTSSVYKILQDGTALKLWSTSRSQIHSVWLAGEDSLMLGTGDEGTVYCLASGELELVREVEESQILDILGRDGTLFLSTGNGARIYSAGPSVCAEGALVSKPFDAVGISRWGNLDWKADAPHGTSVAFRLRAGNSEKPDRTWGGWSDELDAPGPVSGAPQGRFVQWEALLRSPRGGSSPVLRKVTLSYLERNLPPKVGSVRVIPQGVPFASGGIDRVAGRVSQTLPGGVSVEYSLAAGEEAHVVEEAAWARIFRTAVWDASDPNGDRQIFSIFYRATGEENWTLLEEDFRELIYTWNTASFPDGSYLLRVVSSDLPDNIPSEALTAESTSLPFEVDNTPPVVSGLRLTAEPEGLRIEGKLSDNMSPLVGLDYSVDGSSWTRLRSSDGLLDSREESFSWLLEGLSAGGHSIVVRVRDLAGNIGTARASVD